MQRFFFPDQPIGAGVGQPAKLSNIGRIQLDTIIHDIMPVCITLAAAGLAIEQLAADVGSIYICLLYTSDAADDL